MSKLHLQYVELDRFNIKQIMLWRRKIMKDGANKSKKIF